MGLGLIEQTGFVFEPLRLSYDASWSRVNRNNLRGTQPSRRTLQLMNFWCGRVTDLGGLLVARPGRWGSHGHV